MSWSMRICWGLALIILPVAAKELSEAARFDSSEELPQAQPPDVENYDDYIGVDDNGTFYCCIYSFQ